MRSDSPAFIWDALQAARAVSTFILDVDFDQYSGDLMRRSAVERQFEIIGEALNNLRRADPEIAGHIPGLTDAVGLRNILIHGYAAVVDERVYDTAVGDVPTLIEVLSALLDGAEAC